MTKVIQLGQAGTIKSSDIMIILLINQMGAWGFHNSIKKDTMTRKSAYLQNVIIVDIITA